jgi:hypothetical protein
VDRLVLGVNRRRSGRPKPSDEETRRLTTVLRAGGYRPPRCWIRLPKPVCSVGRKRCPL